VSHATENPAEARKMALYTRLRTRSETAIARPPPTVNRYGTVRGFPASSLREYNPLQLKRPASLISPGEVAV
jgi:hypothetical protein